MKYRISKYLSLGGLMAPVIFAAMVIYCADLRLEYSHIDQFISELGATATPNAKLMNYLGFLPTGFFTFLFATTLALRLNKPVIWRTGFGLLCVFGLGILFAGLFSCDQGCPDSGSLASNIHQTIAPITFVSAISGIFLSGISFRRFTQWKKLFVYSIVSSLLALGFLVLLVQSLESRVNTGLWQRLLLLVLFAWTAIVGIRSYRMEQSKSIY